MARLGKGEVATDTSWNSIKIELRECPYSLPDDQAVEECVALLLAREAGLRRGIASAAAKLQQRGLDQQVDRLQKDREIHESNAIEFAGASSLKETSEILISPAATEALDAHSRGMLATAITREPKQLDILGLNNARVLAQNILRGMESGRPLTEVDIRDLHRHTVPGKSFAGRYKDLPNEISGSDHTPPLPEDIPVAMQQLVAWVNRSESIPASLLASITHAWFANLHPFDDGNGRVARLLVNLILARHRLPPVIIDHRARRDDYIDALALSDEAGDIFPLTKLLYESQKKFVKEINRPAYLRKLVDEFVSENDASRFRRWTSAQDRFMLALSAQLAQRKMSLVLNRDVDALTFKRLVQRIYHEERWIATVYGTDPERDPQIRVGITVPPADVFDALDTKERYPGMFFQIRMPDDRQDALRNIWFGSDFRGIRSVAVRPGPPSRIYISYDGSPSRLQWGLEEDAAETVASAMGAELLAVPRKHRYSHARRSLW